MGNCLDGGGAGTKVHANRVVRMAGAELVGGPAWRVLGVGSRGPHVGCAARHQAPRVALFFCFHQTHCLRCDSRSYRGASARREFKHASAPAKKGGGPRRSHPRDTPGWTTHQFGAGHKQPVTPACSWALVPAPPPSGQFPTWPPVSLDRGPRGASAAGPHIPMVGNHGGIFLPPDPVGPG